MNAVANTNVGVDTNVPTNTNTAIDDWVLYTNATYGFSLRYPGDWELRNSQDSIQSFARRSTTQTYPSKDDPLDAWVSLRLLNNPNLKTLQQVFDDEYASCMQNPPDIGCPAAEQTQDWKTLSVGGASALRSGVRTIILPVDSIYINRGSYFLVLNATYYNRNGTYDLAPVFEKILSTFQFTN